MRIVTALFITLIMAGPADARPPVPGPVRATIINVYDGDTMTVDAHPWPQITLRVSVRIQGIDTPELRRSHCLDEKTLALAAKEQLISLVGDEVLLSDIFLGKYAGRVIAHVATSDGTDIGRAMIEKGFAVPYDGGARRNWCAAG